MTNPQFTGTVAGFTSAFPALLRNAALAAGLDPQVYEKETAYIISAVQTCGSITPQIGRSITSKFGQEILSKLGTQYLVCDSGGSASTAVKKWNQNVERGVIFRLSVIGPPGGRMGMWQDGLGFKLQIMFYGMNTNPYPIVSATITPH